MKRFALAAAPILALAMLVPGCTSGPALPTGPVDVHVVHRFQNVTADSFGVPANAGVMHVVIVIENFYKGRCPGPVAQIALQEPSGAEHARLSTQNLPFNDCVYTYEKNETLASGFWTIRYIGGSDSIGSIVDVRPVGVETIVK